MILYNRESLLTLHAFCDGKPPVTSSLLSQRASFVFSKAATFSILLTGPNFDG